MAPTPGPRELNSLDGGTAIQHDYQFPKCPRLNLSGLSPMSLLPLTQHRKSSSPKATVGKKAVAG